MCVVSVAAVYHTRHKYANLERRISMVGLTYGSGEVVSLSPFLKSVLYAVLATRHASYTLGKLYAGCYTKTEQGCIRGYAVNTHSPSKLVKEAVAGHADSFYYVDVTVLSVNSANTEAGGSVEIGVSARAV